ncbi:MAG: DUF2339 domain-containing protein [Gammaproteobacteria bacterium]|nr:DUF2339 domain-containing protein [Gammaproteobacteria bacterium]
MTLYFLIGLVLGLAVGMWTVGFGAELLYSGLIGGLVGWVLHLSSRLRGLEEEFDAAAGLHARPEPAKADPEPAPSAATAVTEEVEAVDAVTAPGPTRDTPSRPERESGVWGAEPAGDEPVREPGPSATDQVLDAAKNWFTTGNVPVKVGVVVVLFGVGFFIKYAIDNELFAFPVWARMAGLALFGLVMFGMGWRLREQREVYGLSLQGGGLGILYLTTYAAFEFYALLPATVAFGAMVVVTVAAGLVAVIQNARTLIVLGIAGGFLAPLLAATEEGNHVALFSYYAVLNAAILTIAWFKAWRILNLLGFAFTFVIASFWGYQGYRPEHFTTTEPFLILFVLMYIGVAVLFALRRPPNLRGFVDSAVVFGTPFIGFALQTQLVESEAGLAWSAGGLAALYAVLAAGLWRINDLRTLAMCFLGLALAFLALAFPLALDDRWTCAAWAAQGAMLAWFSVRSGSRLLLIAGAALQVAAALAHAQAGLFDSVATPLLNGPFLTGVVLALAGWTVAWSFDHSALPASARRAWTRIALFWAGAWWFWSAAREITEFVVEDVRGAVGLGTVGFSAIAATLVAKAVGWRRLDSLAFVLLPAMVGMLAFGFWMESQPRPLANYGWLAWPVALGAQYAFLYYREDGYPGLTPGLHVGAYWVLAVLVASEVRWLVEFAAGGDWPLAFAVASAAGLALATGAARARLPWPLDAHWHAYSAVGIPVVAGAAGVLVLAASLSSDGSAAPLPYLPLVNPLTMAAAAAGVAIWRALDIDLRRPDARTLVLLFAVVGLVVLSMEVARGVHHFAGVPFTAGALAGSAIFQAGLSLVWGTAGLAGMVAGARREHRDVWIGGAVVMGLVIVKLFLVELGNVGTLSRVVSFLGVGLLLLIVGYLAPVPKGRNESGDPETPTVTPAT